MIVENIMISFMISLWYYLEFMILGVPKKNKQTTFIGHEG